MILLLTAAGCWNRREAQDLTISTAVGIDRIMVDGHPLYLLSVLSRHPSTTGGGSSATVGQMPAGSPRGIVISAEGETIYDAVRNFSMRSSRQLFLSHTMVLVIGEETARGGITQIIDFFIRHKDIRLRTWVVVCEGLARDALQSQPEKEPLLSEEITKMIEQNRPRVSKVAGADIFQVMHDLLTPGIEAAVTHMKLFVPPETTSPARSAEPVPPRGDSPGGSPGTEGEEEEQPQQKTFTISGAAVFRGDRLVGRLDEEETQGMLFINGQSLGGIIPFAFGAAEKNASFLFRGLNTRVKPLFNEDGSIEFKILIKGFGELLEENAVIEISRDDLKQAEELINQEVVRRCQEGISRAQELKSDVFGFGDKIYRTEPGKWELIKDQWEEIFSTVKVDVVSDMRIEHVGQLRKPIQVE